MRQKAPAGFTSGHLPVCLPQGSMCFAGGAISRGKMPLLVSRLNQLAYFFCFLLLHPLTQATASADVCSGI